MSHAVALPVRSRRPSRKPRTAPPSPTDRARRFARAVHLPDGEDILVHVERVASRVPESARRVALVHRVCVPNGHDPAVVARLLQFDTDERDALALLATRTGEGHVAHVRRITRHPSGTARELALVVKRAVLDVGPGDPSVRSRARDLIDRAWRWPVA